MSISFASKISALRREKNITQKVAAEDLGISQALLSHYEKGIRECNLDFVVKAATYYNVSSDYLLGLSETKHGSGDLLDDSELPSDTQINSKTIMRALMFLQNSAETEDDLEEAYFNDFFALSIKKYISTLSSNKRLVSDLCNITMTAINYPHEKKDYSNILSPVFIKTIETYSSDLIKRTVSSSTNK